MSYLENTMHHAQGNHSSVAYELNAIQYALAHTYARILTDLYSTFLVTLHRRFLLFSSGLEGPL